MDSPRLDQIEAEILKGLSDLARVLESFQRGSANAGRLLSGLERGEKVPRNELQHCAQVFQRFSTDTALLALVKEIERRVTLDLVQPLRVRVNLDDRVGAPPQSMTTTSDDDAGIASARTGLLSATEGLEALLRGASELVAAVQAGRPISVNVFAEKQAGLVDAIKQIGELRVELQQMGSDDSASVH